LFSELHMANGVVIRQVNRSTVLNLIRQEGSLSRADVKRKTGLTFSTVSSSIADLIDDGLLREWGQGASNGGRRPTLVSLNPTGRYVLGCELQAASLRVGLFDLTGSMLACVEHEERPATPDAVVQQIAAGVFHVLDRSGVSLEQVEGMGVAAPGPLSPNSGILRTPPNLPGWRDVPLKRMLELALDLPVLVEKDGNAAALGEAWLGAGQHARSLVFIIVDTGIGSGILLNGQLHRGRNDGAGEIGHTTVDLDGPACRCGGYGCLEAMASGLALSRKAAAAVRRGVDSCLSDGIVTDESSGVPTLLRAAAAGDGLANDLLDECGRFIGIAIANVVNMYNPELIVLGGRLALHHPQVVERACELGRRRAFPTLAQSVSVVPSTLGDAFLMKGAASLVLQRIFGPTQQ